MRRIRKNHPPGSNGLRIEIHNQKKMIPKIVHYCWFGRGKKPDLVEKCINSWYKLLPDYIIREWNEDNFDVNYILYSQEAYSKGKYAFVSDFARFKILFEEGGIYLDTDVELLKNIDDLLIHSAFTGFENDHLVAPGLILASEKGNLLMRKMCEEYLNSRFINNDLTLNTDTVVKRFTNTLIKSGLILNGKLQIIDNLIIFPSDYFAPKSFESGEINISSNTYSIHHYRGSWQPKYQIMERKFWRLFNQPNHQILLRIKNKVLNNLYEFVDKK